MTQALSGSLVPASQIGKQQTGHQALQSHLDGPSRCGDGGGRCGGGRGRGDRDGQRVSLKIDDTGSVKIMVTLSSIARVLDPTTEAGAPSGD